MIQRCRFEFDTAIANQPSMKPTTKRPIAAMADRAITLFDYEAKLPKELSFGKNELLTVLEKRSSGWWLGTTSSGAKGLFPR